MKSSPYKLNGKLFRYNFDTCIVEYIMKADKDDLEAEEEWKRTHDGRTFSYQKIQVGDYVEQAVVDNAMDCLPPACMTGRCSQMGEPYSHREDPETGEWKATYATFKKVGGEWPHGIWQYCGHCFRGENVERGKDPVYC